MADRTTWIVRRAGRAVRRRKLAHPQHAADATGVLHVRHHDVVALRRKPWAECIGVGELLEARRSIEGEACALAASRIDESQLVELEVLIAEMFDENEHDVVKSEDADRRFHELIARSTQNSGMIAAVQMLWDARTRSPQNRSMSTKVRAKGVKPRIDEHTAIVDALRRRDPEAARAAMRDHLSRVIGALLEATEFEELERARAHIAEQRRRYALSK